MSSVVDLEKHEHAKITDKNSSQSSACMAAVLNRALAARASAATGQTYSSLGHTSPDVAQGVKHA